MDALINKRFYDWCDNYHNSLKEKYPCMLEGHVWLAGFFNTNKKLKFKNRPFDQSMGELNALKTLIIKLVEGNLPNFPKRYV